MALSVAERKHLMPFGAQKEVAEAESVSEAFVSQVLVDERHPKTERGRKTVRRVQVALARKLGMRVDDVFQSTSIAPPAHHAEPHEAPV